MSGRESNDRLTVLCHAFNAVGHMHSMLGIACALKRRNHRVIYVAERSWREKLSPYEFELEFYDEQEKASENVADCLIKLICESLESLKKPALEQYGWYCQSFLRFIENTKFAIKQLNEILSRVKPDVILVDSLVPDPPFIKTNLPLVYVYSPNPLYVLNDERLPVGFSGLPLNDKSQWKIYKEALEKSQEMFAIEANKWLKEQDVPPLPKNSYRHFSTNLNVYIFPKPLMEDYLRLCELGDEWFGLDQSIRESKESFKMPENFKTENEKLIYFSMGSFGSNVVELMSRLLKILAKCKHKIIVVTGNFKDKLELADNMWGDSFLPQLEILPLVDLVITHGGNNTFVETLYFGKPMIVMPLFADQHDNARRAVETKIGPAFNPFTVEESELLNAIDATLNDSETPKRIKIISEQIRESNAMDVLSQKLVQIARNPKFPTVM